MRTLVLGLMLALAVPAVALGQSVASADTPAAQSGTQSGTSGNGNGSQSGGVSNNQKNTQNANGNGNQQNATNQNCVAGRDCVNNNITNQNQNSTPVVHQRVFERVPVPVRATRVRRVHLAFTGFDLRLLFLVGGLATAGGAAVLMTARRRRLSSDLA